MEVVKVPYEKNPSIKFTYHKLKANELSKLKDLLPNRSFDEVVLHWAGSSYTGYSRHYQINICLDPNSNEPFALVADKSTFGNPDIHSHTYKRNTGKIGVSFICMFDIKKYPVTESMIQLASQVNVILCEKYDLDPIIDIKDHADYARMDFYSHLRWDTELKLSTGEDVTGRVKNLTKKALTVEIKPKARPIPEVKKDIFKYFKDVESKDWFSNVVNEFFEKGMIAKTDYFYPNRPITRGEAAGFISNFLQNRKFYSKVGFTFVFKDVESSAWYYSAINTVVSNGIMSGNKDMFAPNKILTRAELSIILYKTLMLLLSESQKLHLPLESSEGFLDVSSKDWFYNEICLLTNLSILIGYKESSGHYFRPEKTLTRSEFLVGLDKVENYLQEFSV